MRVVGSILSFTFAVGCGFGTAPPPSILSAAQSVELPAVGVQPADVFSRMLQSRLVKRTSFAISLAPQVSKIRPRVMNLARGRLPVLSLPVAITNSSAHEIRMNLAHEWSGGIWPQTDLYVAVELSGVKGKFWSNAPGYQVGEKGSADRLVVLKPGEAKTFDIRLNWPGTGSLITVPLIDESKLGRYSIKFLLFFRANGSGQFVESEAADIEVQQ